MKQVTLRNGHTIRTPWLRIEEAAAYCGISRTTFEKRAASVPFGGNDRTRLYHTSVLDQWMLEGAEDAPIPSGRKICGQREDDGILVNAKNGTVYR